MTTNDPLPLLTIAELWAMDPGGPPANHVKEELLGAIWEGGFSDGTVFVYTPQFLEIVLPPGHDQNVWDGPPLEVITRARVIETLADLAGDKLPQALKDVRDGPTRVAWAESDNSAPKDPSDPTTPSGSSKNARFTLIQEDPADPATLVGYPFNSYNPKQQALLESLRVSLSALADWCDRTGRQRPSFLEDPRYGLVQSGPTYATGEAGRPSNRTLFMAEFNRRAELDLVEKGVAAEARALKIWLDGNHPNAPNTEEKTIENAIREPYRLWRSSKSGKTP